MGQGIQNASHPIQSRSNQHFSRPWLRLASPLQGPLPLLKVKIADLVGKTVISAAWGATYLRHNLRADYAQPHYLLGRHTPMSLIAIFSIPFRPWALTAPRPRGQRH